MAFSFVLLLAGSVFAQTGGTYDLTWNTIDGGGGTVTGGTYSLSFTAGQHDAGDLSGGTYTLRGGYWDAAAAPSPQDILKNRYISIDPRVGGGGGQSFHIRVTLTATLVNGVTAVGSSWWANAPDANCIAIVGPTQPVSAPNWDACPTLHLSGCPIIPTSHYDIEVFGGVIYAAQTQAKPGVKWWGDCVGIFNGTEWTPPQGTTNIDDAVAAIKTWQQDPNAETHVSVTDVHPNQSGFQINKVVNFDDVFQFVQAFQGNEYPGPAIELCTDP